MLLLDIIYQILIGPLRILMEVIYGLAYSILGSIGASIVPLSLAVNFLLLPFYKRADAMQQQERDIQERMAHGLAHIKKSFRGDERYMMQEAYYRISRYRPVYALRSALPLLLQVPFFIAAYQFLSNFELFEGATFWFIVDLSKPDGLMSVGGFSINILPLIMTAINLFSSTVYAQRLRTKERLQLYGMALVFLVLLYESPSGLVFYWTLNNLFSLGKNAVACASKPALAKNAVLSSLGAFVFAYALFKMEAHSFNQLLVVLGSVCFQLPSILCLIKRSGFARNRSTETIVPEGKPELFLMGALLMAVLSGVLIPSSVICSSPAEFILISDYHSPVIYVARAFALGIGLFVFWLGLFYCLSSQIARMRLEVVIWVVCACCLINYLFFGTEMGLLNRQLQYENSMSFASLESTVNAEVCLFASAIVVALWVKKRPVIAVVAPIILLTVVALSAKSVVEIQLQMPGIRAAIDAGQSDVRTIRLSRSGKNVVVIMMDRAASCFVPYALQEKPELAKQYDGFTWFPNTLSYGPQTNTGVPAVYGGYEYTPEEMNRRSELKLVDKQNEALRLMPDLFDEAGYQVTVCDPTYANYSWIPDVSIYDSCPSITAFNIENGGNNDLEEDVSSQFAVWNRNFFCFGLMKLSPLVVQPILYQDGTYFNPDRYGRSLYQSQVTEGLSKSKGLNELFMQAYNAISSLPGATQIVDTEKSSFFMIGNSTTHDLALLQEPEYVPEIVVDNTEYDAAHSDRFTVDGREMKINDVNQIKSYQVNMAALLKMGQWFDYLRSEGVYDNTRIIIVADHGVTLHCFDDLVFGKEPYEDVTRYNPLLLVKDFNSHGFTRDDTFMTNADTPLLAFEGLIENPVNPFTGKQLTDATKHNDEQHLFFTTEWQTTNNNGNQFLPGTWLSVTGQNIFDVNNWKVLGEGTDPNQL